MKWITPKNLQEEFGLPWSSAERIIREQVHMLDRRRDWHLMTVGVLRLAGLFWASFGARLTFASAHGWRLALLELPGLAVLALAWLVLPRLLAADAILATARGQRTQVPPRTREDSGLG